MSVGFSQVDFSPSCLLVSQKLVLVSSAVSFLASWRLFSLFAGVLKFGLRPDCVLHFRKLVFAQIFLGVGIDWFFAS